MKAFAIPTFAAAANAGLSVLFFAGLSRVLGDHRLGEIILVQSSVALLQIACVPQAWVYIFGAPDAATLKQRYSVGVTAELTGIVLGALLLFTVIHLPFDFVAGWHGGAFAMYGSLVVQASSSATGWLRARDRWRSYTIWTIAPNLLRVPLIWASPLLARHGMLMIPEDRTAAILLYFTLADAVRWLLIYLPLVRRHYRFPGFAATAVGTREILHNWFYDIGSAVTDVADKIVVGAVMGPQLLVVYFFARRLGIVATMVNEPFFAEHFRRIGKMMGPLRSAAQTRIYRHGLMLSAVMFAGVAASVAVATRLPELARLLPSSIAPHLSLFVLILGTDCALAANRWSRFVTQLDGGVRLLLLVRLAAFGLFAAGVTAFGTRFDGLGLCIAFAIGWATEATFLITRLRRTGGRATVVRDRRYS